MSGPDIGDLDNVPIPYPCALSHSGGSGLRIGCVFECPRKCALKFLGWRMKRTAVPLAFGNVIHRHSFQPYAPEPRPVDPVAAFDEVQTMMETEKYRDSYVGLDATEKVIEQEIERPSDKDRADLPDIARLQMEVWDEKRYPDESVTDCERLFVSELVDPETGNVPGEAEAFRVAARIDLRVQREIGSALRDLKTARSPIKEEWFCDIGYHRQLSTQRYLVAAVEHTIIDDLACFQLTKNKRKETIEKHAHEVPVLRPFRFPDIYGEFLTAVRLIQAHAKARHWPMNRYSCEGKYGPCEFLPLCWWYQFDNPNEWETTLQRRERS